MAATSKYYKYIDGLRAIAVLAVVLYHVNPAWVPSGFLGVDIFFVISGFAFSASMAKFDGSFGKFITTFYSRRFMRILPALLVVNLGPR